MILPRLNENVKNQNGFAVAVDEHVGCEHAFWEKKQGVSCGF